MMWGKQQISTPGEMTHLSSYVEQADALLGVLTVEETFLYSARLRCVVPASVTVSNGL